MKDLFFGKFMGEGVNNIIQVLNDLEKESGDRITQSLVLKLKGDGVTGDDILEGNEEKWNTEALTSLLISSEMLYA